MVDLPWSCPTLAANSNKQFKTTGSDRLYQFNCELTNTYLLLVDISYCCLGKYDLIDKGPF